MVSRFRVEGLGVEGLEGQERAARAEAEVANPPAIPTCHKGRLAERLGSYDRGNRIKPEAKP